MAEDGLGDLFQTLELRGASGEHDAGSGNSIQALTYQHFVNSNKEIARTFMEDLGGK